MSRQVVLQVCNPQAFWPEVPGLGDVFVSQIVKLFKLFGDPPNQVRIYVIFQVFMLYFQGGDQ